MCALRMKHSKVRFDLSSGLIAVDCGVDFVSILTYEEIYSIFPFI